jgi:penicillin-binding protein 1A
MNPYDQRTIWYRMLAVATVCATLMAAVAVGGGFLFLKRAGVFEPDEKLIEKITSHQTRSNTIVLARDGSKIGEFYEVDRAFVPFAQLPRGIIQSIVAIEDRNFWSHNGFDPKGIVRAAIANLTGGRTRQGASTISQQLVKAFILGNERTFARKAREVFLAIKLERQISKERILELYANEMFLGSGSYGVAAAAKRYFSKNLDELEPHESALIAGLFQSPSAFNPLRHPQRARARQKMVIQALYSNENISLQQRDEMLRQPLRYKPWSTDGSDAIAPWFLDHVREEASTITGRDIRGEGLTIRTTLDPQLQNASTQAVKGADSNFRRHEHQGRLEAALIAIDPSTGGILAMTGGRNYQVSQFNRAISAKRHPGSAFKTFVYAYALKKGWTWADRMFIDPVKIDDYTPKNLTDEYFTETTMLRAFYRSVNTPAVEVAHKIGLGGILEFARQLGIRTVLKRELGTALGGSETTMVDMASAYATIANAGQPEKPHAITKIESASGESLFQHGRTNEPNIDSQDRAEKPLDDATSWLVTEGLRSVLRHGTARSASSIAQHAVGKTGTSNEGIDSWFCGYSAAVAVAVWVGRDDHTPISDATGTALALPVWRQFMETSLEIPEWRKKFHKPEGIVELLVDPTYGRPTERGIRMSFLEGTQPVGNATMRIGTPNQDQKTEEDFPDIFTR